MDKQILLHCIAPEELKQLIKEVIKEEFVALKKDLAIKESDILLTRSETCELLKIDSSIINYIQQPIPTFI
jgi:hypothetical protein